MDMIVIIKIIVNRIRGFTYMKSKGYN